MVTITAGVTDQVAAIISDTLNGWFRPYLRFDPVVVRPRYDDWYDEDYLEAWIVWEGEYAYMDHSRTNSLRRIIEPRLNELGVTLPLHLRSIAKWEWEPNKERILK